MAEPTPQDVRRLRTLETRLDRAQAERKALLADRRALRRRIGVEERRVRDAEKGRAESEARLGELVEENRALAARLDEATSELEKLRATALRLREQLDAAKAESKEAVRSRRTLERELARAEKGRAAIEERVKAAEAQVKAKGMAPLVPAAQVASLFEQLVSELGTGLPGLAVRDGELHLRVAVGRAGRTSGFVVPTSESPAETLGALHDVTLRFDRALDPKLEE